MPDTLSPVAAELKTEQPAVGFSILSESTESDENVPIVPLVPEILALPVSVVRTGKGFTAKTSSTGPLAKNCLRDLSNAAGNPKNHPRIVSSGTAQYLSVQQTLIAKYDSVRLTGLWRVKGPCASSVVSPSPMFDIF